MLSELHSLNLKLCSNKKIVLHLIVAPQLSSGWWHNYSTKTRQVGWANEQSIYFLMSIVATHDAIEVNDLTYFRVHLPCCLSPRPDISSLINKQTYHQLHNTLNYFNIMTRAMPGTPSKCYIIMGFSSRPIVIWLIVNWLRVSAPFLPVDPHQANEN